MAISHGAVYHAVQGASICLRMKSSYVTIQKKAVEQYFYVVLFALLYKGYIVIFFLFPCYLICINLLSSIVIILNFVACQITNRYKK